MNYKIKKSEFDHFSQLASEWWLKNGKFKILHEIQPIRIKYIQDVVNKKHLDKMKILDLGCGGGLISEELSKIGANVTGIDFIKENINMARTHAIKNKLNIDYKTLDFENEKINSKFDIIVIFEVLEHLSDWKSFIKKIQSNLKSNGVLIISTINKNLISKFLTIDLAENILKWIPLNTHNYHKFIRPKELEFFLNKHNFKNINFDGLEYSPLKRRWYLSKNTNVNYFCSCILS
ncbi:bifunctional 2-polyprenyl-6-hydroxyphenol methylase/3-demethylubiquinol 3-O-methyltransferase UbiG [Pelagibacteraceae bacterium]|nr:bifunctional 2-polyprenyl-6-hydroxyphenol methylase/3-demethylubiquinol 3-O-methyltransferase UbiG [Pelagibacteraceae bacterium]